MIGAERMTLSDTAFRRAVLSGEASVLLGCVRGEAFPGAQRTALVGRLVALLSEPATWVPGSPMRAAAHAWVSRALDVEPIAAHRALAALAIDGPVDALALMLEAGCEPSYMLSATLVPGLIVPDSIVRITPIGAAIASGHDGEARVRALATRHGWDRPCAWLAPDAGSSPMGSGSPGGAPLDVLELALECNRAPSLATLVALATDPSHAPLLRRMTSRLDMLLGGAPLAEFSIEFKIAVLLLAAGVVPTMAMPDVACLPVLPPSVAADGPGDPFAAPDQATCVASADSAGVEGIEGQGALPEGALSETQMFAFVLLWPALHRTDGAPARAMARMVRGGVSPLLSQAGETLFERAAALANVDLVREMISVTQVPVSALERALAVNERLAESDRQVRGWVRRAGGVTIGERRAQIRVLLHSALGRRMLGAAVRGRRASTEQLPRDAQ